MAAPARSPDPGSAGVRSRWPKWSIVDLTVNVPSTAAPGRPPAASTPALSTPIRWKTREFYFYYLVFIAIVPQMWYIAHRATNVTSNHYWAFAPRLRQGWLFGLQIDLSDHQYWLFRSKLPLLVLLAVAHVALSCTYRFLSRRLSPTLYPTSPSYSQRSARDSRARFSATFSLVLLAALHGTSLVKILVILYTNYRIAGLGAVADGDGLSAQKRRSSSGATTTAARSEHAAVEWRWRREWTPYATWAFNIAVLFANSLAEGYYFSSIHSQLAFLDEYKGLLPRWHISWNISMLRLVSFNMEWYWSSSAAIGAAMTAAGEPGGVLPEPPTSPQFKAVNERIRRSTPPSQAALDPSPQAGNYSFVLYLAYVLYPPLYLAGPIMAYPSFVRQLAPAAPSEATTNGPYSSAEALSINGAGSVKPTAVPTGTNAVPSTLASETTPRALSLYAVRFLACLLTMEIVLHTLYVVALKDSGKGWWNGMTPAEVSLVGFWNLIVVWLKLLLPWRFFRLWSLGDGIVPPENMIRCMANNYSVLGFWRAWHRSYNLWVVRYLYIPLGGSARPLLATLGVFTFVALWHDLRLRLLVWGWGITLFVVPEMVGRAFVPASKYGSRPWYRHLAAIGGVANILLLMTANLVGFVVGVDGGKELWRVMLGDWEGRLFLLTASAILFVGVQVMFEYREEERRQGISRKC